jgi:dTDP-4-dehydrorhamnose 3,5-epimerase
MNVQSLRLPEVKVFTPGKFCDRRGFFSETYSKRNWEAAGIPGNFVQDNQSFSIDEGTLRGLHFQIPPFAQDKLIRVLRGSIWDVVVDVRHASQAYGQHVAVEISAEKWNQIYVPAGFAHGLVTLEPNTEVLYKVSNYYSPEHERGLLWNDPELAISWPLPSRAIKMSDRDSCFPRLGALPDYFACLD